MVKKFNDNIFNRIDQPSGLISDAKFLPLLTINTLINVYEQINKQTSYISEKIFDYLITVSDVDLFLGKIPYIKDNLADAEINSFIRILNDLFPLSCRDGMKVIKRDTIEYLSKKTFALAMCYDGGVSLDILCQIVNEENSARIPSQSLSKIKSIEQITKNKNSNIS
jgi:hypothetical protein